VKGGSIFVAIHRLCGRSDPSIPSWLCPTKHAFQRFLAGSGHRRIIQLNYSACAARVRCSPFAHILFNISSQILYLFMP